MERRKFEERGASPRQSRSVPMTNRALPAAAGSNPIEWGAGGPPTERMETDEGIQRINRKKFEEMLRQSPRGGEGPEPGRPVELSDANFRETIKSKPVVVVDFWAPWCGPCRAVSPVLEQLASEMAGKATFGKLNVDDNPRTSHEFGIQGIPTIMVFKDGEPVDGLVGAAPKSMIEARIRPYVDVADRTSPYK
jgi:thioredoxin